MEVDASRGVLLAAGEGEAVTEEPERTVLILNAHPALDVTWSRYEPGERGPDPHFHERHVDAFVVLGGELLFELGGDRRREIVAPAGTLIAAPQEVVHTFGNHGSETATFLNLHAPSCGFADSLRGRDVAFDSVDASAGGGRDPDEAIVRSLTEGDRYRRGEVAAAILLELPELSVGTIEIDGGFEVSPHTHEDHLDSFFVLSGEAEFTLGEQVGRAAAESWAAAPLGVVHGFRHAGPRRTALLNVHAPDAGFAASLRRRFE